MAKLSPKECPKSILEFTRSRLAGHAEVIDPRPWIVRFLWKHPPRHPVALAEGRMFSECDADRMLMLWRFAWYLVDWRKYGSNDGFGFKSF
jgi:hypothetical protein